MSVRGFLINGDRPTAPSPTVGALRDAGHPMNRPCPVCLAKPGQHCIGKRGDRKAFHRQRGSRSSVTPVYEIEEGCESPIEETMLGAILGWIDHSDAAATVSTQIEVGPYRVDILIEADGRKLVVECDGSAFHSSAEAVARDKRRDRFLVNSGFAVMRFTGREINRDPRGCAAEVGAWINLR